MADFLPNVTAEDMVAPSHKKLYAYWQEIKGDRHMPARADFSPLKLPEILPCIILADVHYDPLRFKIRLAGTQVVSVSGLEPTGGWVDDFPHTEKIIERYSWIVKHKKPYLTEDRLRWVLKDYKRYTGLALPFSSDGENVDIIISCNHYY